MIRKILRATGRGQTKLTWLNGRHIFSFGNFYDSQRMGAGPLLVLNDDRIAARSGFPLHPHQNMEIVTIVLEGELAHQDSTGGVGKLSAGDVQIMSAGSGIAHSEANPHAHAELHLLQIWVKPLHLNRAPTYQDFHAGTPVEGEWLHLVGPGSEHQIDRDVSFYRAKLGRDTTIELEVMKSQGSVFCYLISGEIEVTGERFHEGDAFILSGHAPDLALKALADSDILAIELDETL